MYNHKSNINNLKQILDILNYLPNIEYKFPLHKKNLIRVYKNIYYFVDLIYFIYQIKSSTRDKKQIKKKLSKIKDKSGKYIFTKKDINEIYPNLDKLDIIFVTFRGGNKNNPVYILSHLEEKYGPKATVVFEMISSINSTIAYVCSMIVSTLGYPPFSVPPMSLSIFIPKTILRCTKFFFIGYNVFLNISRQNWSIVIKNFLSSFPQFLITENALSTQLNSINKVLKTINLSFDDFANPIQNLMNTNENNRDELMNQLNKYKYKI